MNRYAVALTLLAASAMLFFPVSEMFTPQGVSFAMPDTPVNKIGPAYAVQWRFLTQARAIVPPGVSYTVRDATPDGEMSLFMFSLGLFLEQQPMPSSYYGGARPDGMAARYVLATKAVTPDEPGLRVVARFREGTVYERMVPGR